MNANKKLKTWTAFKKERFTKNPDEAIEYLKATLEENSDDPELVIEAIRDVSEGLGLSTNCKESQQDSLYDS